MISQYSTQSIQQEPPKPLNPQSISQKQAKEIESNKNLHKGKRSEANSNSSQIHIQELTIKQFYDQQKKSNGIQEIKNQKSLLLPKIKVSEKLRQFLFHETYENFTECQTLVYEFFDFLDNIEIIQDQNERFIKSEEFLSELQKAIKEARQNRNTQSSLRIKNINKIPSMQYWEVFKLKLKFITFPCIGPEGYLVRKEIRGETQDIRIIRRKIEDGETIPHNKNSMTVNLTVSIFEMVYSIYYSLQMIKNLLPSQNLFSGVQVIKEEGTINSFKRLVMLIYNSLAGMYTTFNEESKVVVTQIGQKITNYMISSYKSEGHCSKKTAQNYLINFLSELYFYNYIVKCNEFIKNEKLSFKQYLVSIKNQEIKIQQQKYLLQKKLCLQKTIAQDRQKGYMNQILRRIWIDSFDDKLSSSLVLLEKMQQNLQNSFSMQMFFEKIYPIQKERLLIQLQIKYCIHLQQYYHELIAELTQAKNIFLDIVFNVIRFIDINLVLHFSDLAIQRIDEDIERKCGKMHKNLFIKLRNEDQKWKNCVQKSKKAINLSFQKTCNYIESIKDIRFLQQSANVQKIKIILDQNKSLMGLFIALNLKKIPDFTTKSLQSLKDFIKVSQISKIKHIFSLNYDHGQILFKNIVKYYRLFNYPLNESNNGQNQQAQNSKQRPMVLYSFIIDIMAQQVFSSQIFQKTQKKLVKKHLGQDFLKHFQSKKIDNFSQTYKKLYDQKYKDNLIIRNKIVALHKQSTISVIQLTKLFNLFTTIYLFSFETQRENQRIRYGRLFNPELRRKKPQSIKQILKTLDLFYIHKAQRLNTHFLLTQPIEQIQYIKRQYIRYALTLCQLYQVQRFSENEKSFKITQYQHHFMRWFEIYGQSALIQNIQKIKDQQDCHPRFLVSKQSIKEQYKSKQLIAQNIKLGNSLGENYVFDIVKIKQIREIGKQNLCLFDVDVTQKMHDVILDKIFSSQKNFSCIINLRKQLQAKQNEIQISAQLSVIGQLQQRYEG